MKWWLAFAALLLVWLGAVAGWIGSQPDHNQSDTADVAIVLGAAVLDDLPSPVFAARIDHAIELYQAGKVRSLIFTGGRSPEDTLSESASARNYAISAGVPVSDIAIEEQSRTTHQNLIQAKQLMAAKQMETALIVSDPLHLRRAGSMAQALDITAKPSATPHTKYRSWSTKLPFLVREVFFIHYFWVMGE